MRAITQPRDESRYSSVALKDFAICFCLGAAFIAALCGKGEAAGREALQSGGKDAGDLLRETADGFGFGIENIEDGQQLGDLQDFLELAAEVAEAQRGTLRLYAVMRGDERAEPGAVDKGDVVHVQDDLPFAFGDQAFYFFAQRVAFLTEHNAAVQRHHGDAIHFSIRHLQSHVIFLLIANGFRRQPGPEPSRISVIVRTGHVITADRTDQLAPPRLQPLRADGTIPRSIFGPNGAGQTTLRGPSRLSCGLCWLAEDLNWFLLRGAFHSPTVIAHPPAGEKLGGSGLWSGLKPKG